MVYFMSSERQIKALLWTVSMIWGLNVVMIKFLVGQFPPTILAALRIGAAALALVAVVAWKRQLFTGLHKISANAWACIIIAGLSGIFVHQTTLSIGLQTANASTGSVILGLNPLVTGILAYVFFREPLTWNRIVGVILAFTGVVVVVLGDSFTGGHVSLHFGKGEWFVVLAMLTYVISGLCIKKAAETVPVITITVYTHIVGAGALATAALFELRSLPDFSLPVGWFPWMVLLFSGWVATALCAIFWNNAIQKIGAGRTTMFINGMPVASLVFAVLLLGERFIWLHAIGFATVFAGIWIGTMKLQFKQRRVGSQSDKKQHSFKST